MARLRPSDEAAMAGPITFRDKMLRRCGKALRRINYMKQVIDADLSRRSAAYLDMYRRTVTIRNAAERERLP
jgi:hypothetical protein